MRMSQNLRFSATVLEDAELDHPPGAVLVRQLSAELIGDGWRTSEVDNWRDCGSVVVCYRCTSVLQVIVSQIANGEWMLQVSPHRMPGPIGRFFGMKRSASETDVYEFAVAVHKILMKLQYLGKPQWRWDGFPDAKHSTSEPQAR